MLGSAKRSGEFAPPFDVELPVRAREVLLDCLHDHEQVPRDLPAGTAMSRPARDPQLARRQCPDACNTGPPRPPPGSDELLARPLGDGDRAAAVGQIQRLAQRLARLRALAGAPRRAELEMSFGAPQQRRGPVKLLTGGEQFKPSGSALGEADRAKPDSRRA